MDLHTGPTERGPLLSPVHPHSAGVPGSQILCAKDCFHQVNGHRRRAVPRHRAEPVGMDNKRRGLAAQALPVGLLGPFMSGSRNLCSFWHIPAISRWSLGGLRTFQSTWADITPVDGSPAQSPVLDPLTNTNAKLSSPEPRRSESPRGPTSPPRGVLA